MLRIFFKYLGAHPLAKIQPVGRNWVKNHKKKFIKNLVFIKFLSQYSQYFDKLSKRMYLDYTRVFSAASKHSMLTDWLFWSLLKHLGMISISFDMFGSCHFFICIFYENHWFFCLYFVLFTFVYNVKFSNWSMTVQMYKTINKKNKTDS